MAYSETDKKSIFNSVIKNIEKGSALRSILKKDNMPSSQTFYKWLEEDKKKSKRYAHACEMRADNIFEDILSIADNNTKDIITDQDGNNRVDKDVVQRSRVMIDARKWYLSKLNPKKYGDKVDTTVTIKEQPLFGDD